MVSPEAFAGSTRKSLARWHCDAPKTRAIISATRPVAIASSSFAVFLPDICTAARHFIEENAVGANSSLHGAVRRKSPTAEVAVRLALHPVGTEIGRASCRERV